MKFAKYILLFLSVFLLTVVVSYKAFLYYTENIPMGDKRITLEIERGAGLNMISKKLMDYGVINNDKIFMVYALLKGNYNILKAGEYEFHPNETISRIYNRLIEGDVVLKSVTIPEGLNSMEIADLLDEKGLFDRQDFIDVLNNKSLVKELLGEHTDSFEGYLFPDTYSYTDDLTPEQLTRMMAKQFNRVVSSLDMNSNGLQLSEEEILILASMIEKEAGNENEREIISAVFHNRLMKGMKLESDPTVIYGLGESYDGNLTKGHLNTTTEYNTYTNLGLPPGPISNPGKESIVAALNPAKVDYLYFVSKGDGSHEFSTNYSDHQRAVYEYQKRRNMPQD